MLFNSIEYLLFFTTAFLIYWLLLKNFLNIQNLFILAISYLFYGWWDWRFLFLIFLSTVVDYLIGKSLGSTEHTKKRKLLLTLSLVFNLGILGVFKYFNFFIDSLIALSGTTELTTFNSLNIILPVGISFYTFQTLSYSIDVYRKKLEPETNFINFAAFVSFFPQLVAGPIERASNLLPQFKKPREFSYPMAIDACRQILWGLFKKIVIADQCAIYANQIFGNSADSNGSTLFLGAILFAFQIYGDFSGYSDIAIGSARLLGFNLMKNFAFPYFSRDIAEFWRRWHISLSTWFRDYLYIPLGGSKGPKWMVIRNVFVIFLTSGLWHGANWTFVAWGLMHALFFIPLLVLGKNRKNLDHVASNKFLPNIKEIVSILFTFVLVTLAWILFRSTSMHQAIDIYKEIFSTSILSMPTVRPLWLMLTIAGFCFIEWLGRHQEFGIERLSMLPNRFLRYTFYYLLVFMIFWNSSSGANEFIYFQF